MIALKNADGTLSGDQILIEKGFTTGTIRSRSWNLPMVSVVSMTIRYSTAGGVLRRHQAADTLVGNAYANHYLGLGGDDTINGVWTVTTVPKEAMATTV